MRTTWLDIPAYSGFGLANLPLGTFRNSQRPEGQAATRLGDWVVDLGALQRLGYLAEVPLPPRVFDGPYLNPFLALGRPVWQQLREKLTDLFDQEQDLPLRRERAHQLEVLLPIDQVEMLMPIQVGDYTDFYASEYHARNVGRMFRGPENALPPNWKHLPIAYHGRASSLVVSGTSIRRPWGQVLASSGSPSFAPSQRLDFEVEMAWVVGGHTQLGQPVSITAAEDYLFGCLLFNDWSARDIQRWEYQPLGPFLGKSFASSVSPWIVPLEALEPFRVVGPRQDPPVLPYLQPPGPGHFDIELEVWFRPEGSEATCISQSNSRHLYWSMAQMLAHHVVNGCNLRVGDLMASGTISGPEPGSYGSLLEIAKGGENPLDLPDGSQRQFLLDGDEVEIKAYAQRGDLRIDWGSVTGQILPALAEPFGLQ